MENNNEEYIAITYMRVKKGKWKISTDVIESSRELEYKKYRILSIMTMDEYYRQLEVS